MRPLRSLFVFKLGTWAGMMGAAVLVRRALPSRGGEESNEVGLVAVLNGIELESRADAFKGGSIFAWFGGVNLDLSKAELAPGAELSVNALFGGIAIKTPASWRVDSNLRALAGGVDVGERAMSGADGAPVLVVDGMALFGGIAVDADEDTSAAG
jgi:hypothetical protein